MEVRFCETSRDLHLGPTLEEIAELEGKDGFIPILIAKKGDYTFWLRKYGFDLEGESAPPDGIQVDVPEGEFRDAWIISISEDAYRRFVNTRDIGTRYMGSSKLKILYAEDWEW